MAENIPQRVESSPSSEGINFQSPVKGEKRGDSSVFTDYVGDVLRSRRDIASEKDLKLTKHRTKLHEVLEDEHERRTRPVTYEMTTALEHVHEALPAGATKTIVEHIRQPMRIGTRAVDFFGRTYDRAMMGVVLYALRGPAYYAIGLPRKDRTRAAVGPRGVEFGKIQKDKPLVLSGFQPRFEVLPVAIVASMMPHFRRWQARQAATNFEALAKSKIGQETVKKVDMILGDRVDRVIQRFESLLGRTDRISEKQNGEQGERISEIKEINKKPELQESQVLVGSADATKNNITN